MFPHSIPSQNCMQRKCTRITPISIWRFWRQRFPINFYMILHFSLQSIHYDFHQLPEDRLGNSHCAHVFTWGQRSWEFLPYQSQLNNNWGRFDAARLLPKDPLRPQPRGACRDASDREGGGWEKAAGAGAGSGASWMIQRRIFIATMHCCGLFIDRVYCWGKNIISDQWLSMWLMHLRWWKAKGWSLDTPRNKPTRGLILSRVDATRKWAADQENEQLTKALGPFLELLWHLFESIGFLGLAELRSQSSRRTLSWHQKALRERVRWVMQQMICPRFQRTKPRDFIMACFAFIGKPCVERLQVGQLPGVEMPNQQGLWTSEEMYTISIGIHLWAFLPWDLCRENSCAKALQRQSLWAAKEGSVGRKWWS